MFDSPIHAQRIVLGSRPKGESAADDFRLESHEVQPPADGQILLKVRLLSLDRYYLRGRMNDAKPFIDMLNGGNSGKLLVRAADPD